MSIDCQIENIKRNLDNWLDTSCEIAASKILRDVDTFYKKYVNYPMIEEPIVYVIYNQVICYPLKPIKIHSVTGYSIIR